MNEQLNPEALQAMLKLSEALRAKLAEEKAALLAQPSRVFQPRSDTAEGRELERTAFAKGLHHAAISHHKKD